MASDNSNKIDPVYHFNENFSSAFFGDNPAEVSGAKNPATDARLINNFIDLLTNPDKKDLKQEALDIIRNAKAQQFLVDLISMPEQEKHRRELVMACWESGLDFSSHLIFFTKLVVNCGYPVALEAITVIDEMHVLTDALNTNKAIEILSSPSLTADKQALVSETLERLTNFSQ